MPRVSHLAHLLAVLGLFTLTLRLHRLGCIRARRFGTQRIKRLRVIAVLLLFIEPCLPPRRALFGGEPIWVREGHGFRHALRCVRQGRIHRKLSERHDFRCYDALLKLGTCDHSRCSAFCQCLLALRTLLLAVERTEPSNRHGIRSKMNRGGMSRVSAYRRQRLRSLGCGRERSRCAGRRSQDRRHSARNLLILAVLVMRLR